MNNIGAKTNRRKRLRSLHLSGIDFRILLNNAK